MNFVEIDKHIFYDQEQQQLMYDRKRIELTPYQTKIFDFLIKADGHVVLRKDLMLELWQTEQYIGEGTLTTHISRLRQKLKKEAGMPLICTAKGKGYYIPKKRN